MSDFNPAVFDDPRFKVGIRHSYTPRFEHGKLIRSEHWITVIDCENDNIWQDAIWYMGDKLPSEKQIDYNLKESVWKALIAKGIFNV